MQTIPILIILQLVINDIKIEFINDRFERGVVDRNVIVDNVKVDNYTFQTESNSYFSTGSWASTDGCKEGNKSTDTLHCNGYFRYTIGDAGQLPMQNSGPQGAVNIAFSARGETGEEKVELRIRDNTVKSWNLG